MFIRKIIVLLLIFISFTGCASMGGKDTNPTKLDKSPCACGKIYNGNNVNV